LVEGHAIFRFETDLRRWARRIVVDRPDQALGRIPELADV
jgi:hypothetical protein